MSSPPANRSEAFGRARACRAVATLLLVAGAVAAGGTLTFSASPKFFDDDPLWSEPVSQAVTHANRYEPDLFFETVSNLFGELGDKQLGQRARNLNTIDEVPDGPTFTNRAGRVPLTPDLVARAANRDDGLAPGAWTVVSAKSDGITPGFTIRDTAGTTWFVKFDPPGWPAMATGAEIVAAKLFWALGYNTAEYHIARLVPSNLTIAPDATITPAGQGRRRMVQADIGNLLARADRDREGHYRVIVSKAAPGRPVGRIRFHGTRADDPNDVIPHEHRRELRAYRVFAAWLNHVDAKGINSLAVLVTENGRSTIRNYLLDFGSALGSAAVGPREAWEGYEPLVEPRGDIGRRLFAFGLLIPEWRTVDLYESPAVGRLPRSHATWNPDTWEPHVSNAAFRHLRADDRFWAAHKLTFLTDDLVDAAVREGRFGDDEAVRFLSTAIRERRQRILERYLPAVNPVVDPVLDASGRLTFRNAAVDAHVAKPPSGYSVAWFSFDNAAGTTTPIGSTRSPSTTIEAPVLPATGYVKASVAAEEGPSAWRAPVSIYFHRGIDGWRLVGLERVP